MWPTVPFGGKVPGAFCERRSLKRPPTADFPRNYTPAKDFQL
jgi:hypothetical protein